MKKSMMLFITVILVAVLGGCGKETTEIPQCVSFVLGSNANFPKINVYSEVISDSIYKAAYSYGAASAVVADGNPSVEMDFNIKPLEKKIDNDKRRQLAEENTAQILARMSVATPQEAEVDLIAAINVSADLLHSNDEDGELHMKIIASGLSTSGLLDMTVLNVVETPVTELIEELKAVHSLPDLSKIHVTWVGMGQVSGIQQKITSDYKFKLQERWEAILTEAGAASVKFDSSPLTEDVNTDSLPSCSVVPITEVNLDIATITEDKMPEILKWDEESKITFEPDRAEFVNENAVIEELKPVAEYLKAHPGESVHLFGMTATVLGSESLGTELSLQRAEAVKTILVDEGVCEEQVLCTGLGQKKNPLRVDDFGSNGEQIESMAKKNRAVVLVKGDSEMLQILNKCANNTE